MKKTEIYLPSADPGKRIRAVFAEPSVPPRAVVQIVHGMSEHIGRYLPFIEYLTEQGFAAAGHDHPGHGLSAEQPDDIGFFARKDGADILIRNIRTVTLEAVRRYGDLPVFLLGHSMGSFLLRRCIAVYPGLSGAVIAGTGYFPSAAAHSGVRIAEMICRLKGERAVSPFLQNLALGRCAKAFPGEGPLAWLSKDPENIRIYEADPLSGFPFTAGAYRDFFSALADVSDEKDYEKIDRSLPLLVISGENDPIGGIRAVGKVAGRYRELGFSDVTATVVKNGRHEILNDFGHRTVWNYIAAWIGGHLASIQGG